MKGKRYGDNPKYIFDELIKIAPELHYVWLLNDTEDRNAVAEIPSNVKVVKNSIFHQVYELATAAVWVDSNTKQYGFLKRKNQLYIQTWHGSYGLKKIGNDLQNRSKLDEDIMSYNFDRADLTVSNSDRTSELFRTAFGYHGDILEKGSPRNDVFFTDNGEAKQKVCEAFGIKNKKICLYAPTFRTNFSTEPFDLDFDRVIKTLSDKFGGEWVMLVRLHPVNIKQAAGLIEYTDNIINATDYSVMQELLVGSDVLITDYSSCMFDFVTTSKTCFLYATDMAAYKEAQDYYFELEDLPFPLGTNNDELEMVIKNFDEKKYKDDLNLLFKQVGLAETGKASFETAQYIHEYLNRYA